MNLQGESYMKALAFITAVLMALSLTACARDNTKKPANNTVPGPTDNGTLDNKNDTNKITPNNNANGTDKNTPNNGSTNGTNGTDNGTNGVENGTPNAGSELPDAGSELPTDEGNTDQLQHDQIG
jgi:hypothetical protein